MSEEIHEECGIAAISLPIAPLNVRESAASLLYRLLLHQQNRGQLSAGITTFNPNNPKRLDTFRDIGSVSQAFKGYDEFNHRKLLERLNGQRGIGHVRYATFGSDNKSYAQPFEHKHGKKWKWFSFSFNGNIANYWDLRKQLEAKQYHFILESDTEVLMHYLSFGSRGDERAPLERVFTELATDVDGAYSLAYLNAHGELASIRDPLGFKPLNIAEKDGVVAVASETSALESLGFENPEPIKPGSMVLITESGHVETKPFANSKQKSHCMFEWVYFSKAASAIENKSVYQARYSLGMELAKSEPLEWNAETIVVPVPDSSKPAADGYAFQMGLPVKEGLIRNMFAGRTFIESKNRLEKVQNKFALNKKVIEGKKVVLVEDSIVRGTTAMALVRYLKEKGKAVEVHLRSSCPPIFFPCFYGIDMSTLQELIAARNRKQAEFGEIPLTPEEEQRIAEEIGADSVHYQSMEGLVKAIGLPKNELCLGCLTGRYPTPKANELIQVTAKQPGNGIRIYEQVHNPKEYNQ